MNNQTNNQTQEVVFTETRYNSEMGCNITAWGRPVDELQPLPTLDEIAMAGGLKH